MISDSRLELANYRKEFKMKETKSSGQFVICSLVLFCLAGCAEQFDVVEQVCVQDLEKTQAMQAAQRVLGQMHFVIDKADLQRGYIRTRPLPGAQFFEFWRSDNVGSYNWAQANLHSIRRTAQLNLNQQDSQLCINCSVKVERLGLAGRRAENSSGVYDRPPVEDSEIRKLKLNTENKTWIDLGQDPKLATVILKRVERKIKRSR